jgi:hypothetical protein
MPTATTSNAHFRLTCSLDPIVRDDGDTALRLAYEVEAHEDLYLSDRLWDDDPARYRVPDPQGVYRFVSGGSLRLVFGPPPAPPNLQLLKRYEPFYSRVRAGETRRCEVEIRVPVDEYSALARDVGAPSVLEEVSRAHFVMGYRLRATLAADPAPPINETAEETGYIVHEPSYVISSLNTEPIAVRRRTRYVARFPLPGEPGPAPYVPPSR